LINPTTSLSLLSFRGKVEHSNIFDIWSLYVGENVDIDLVSCDAV
jgi:hypothetical protein